MSRARIACKHTIACVKCSERARGLCGGKFPRHFAVVCVIRVCCVCVQVHTNESIEQHKIDNITMCINICSVAIGLFFFAHTQKHILTPYSHRRARLIYARLTEKQPVNNRRTTRKKHSRKNIHLFVGSNARRALPQRSILSVPRKQTTTAVQMHDAPASRARLACAFSVQLSHLAEWVNENIKQAHWGLRK